MMLTREHLQIARTKFVHRWHAAQTVGERLGNDAVGERFEHVNHAKSLAEYVWRHGAFEESADGAGRVARQDVPHGLEAVVAPVAAKGRAHLRLAARYAMVAARGADDTAPTGDGSPAIAERSEHLDLRQYAEQHPDIEVFARRIVALHRGMLRYYVQMRFLTLTIEERGAEQWTTDDAGEVPEDPVSALRRAFARNIYNALVARARAELLETVVQHPEGGAIATATTERSQRQQFTTTAIVLRSSPSLCSDV